MDKLLYGSKGEGMFIGKKVNDNFKVILLTKVTNKSEEWLEEFDILINNEC